MSSSSSMFSIPKTPSTPRFVMSSCASKPLLSSPLASGAASSSPGPVSPVVEAQARRRSQYKSVGSSRNPLASPSRRYTSNGNTSSFSAAETPQSLFLRERLKAKCFDRARRAREKDIQKRRASQLSSDGFDVDMDEPSINNAEDDDDDPFDDELIRRIMANERRKREHAFRVSFEQNVGSSFDPNMEDVTEWENQLRAVEEELAPPEDLFDDEEYWSELYEEHARNEVPLPGEWQAAAAGSADEIDRAANSPKPIFAQRQPPGNADFDSTMDMEA